VTQTRYGSVDFLCLRVMMWHSVSQGNMKFDRIRAMYLMPRNWLGHSMTFFLLSSLHGRCKSTLFGVKREAFGKEPFAFLSLKEVDGTI